MLCLFTTAKHILTIMNQKYEVAEMELVEIKQELNIMAKRLADFRGSL